MRLWNSYYIVYLIFFPAQRYCRKLTSCWWHRPTGDMVLVLPPRTRVDPDLYETVEQLLHGFLY
jgi:hypothetical protein